MRLIYLDYNSTTPLAGAAREAMLPFLYEFYGSPSSSHWTGAAVAEAVEDARTFVAMLLDCQSHEIVFTSGGTESINLAIRGGLEALQFASRDEPQLILTSWEYAAAHRTAAALAAQGTPVRVVCGGNGAGWNVDAICQAVGDRATLLNLTLADGETGIVQPIEALMTALEASGQREHCLVHLDCCQAMGKINVSLEKLSVDLVSISGHKMYAAKGVGALAVRESSLRGPMMNGEWFERGFRCGMPNVPGIIGLGAAADLMAKSVRKFADRCEHLFEQFDPILAQTLPDLNSRRIPNASRGEVLGNTRLLLLEGRSAESLLVRLPELCVRCYEELTADDDIDFMSGHSEIRPIEAIAQDRFDALLSSGLSPQQRQSAMRISIGWNTTEQEMIRAAEAISEAYRQSAHDAER